MTPDARPALAALACNASAVQALAQEAARSWVDICTAQQAAEDASGVRAESALLWEALSWVAAALAYALCSQPNSVAPAVLANSASSSARNSPGQLETLGAAAESNRGEGGHHLALHASSRALVQTVRSCHVLYYMFPIGCNCCSAWSGHP